MILAVVLGASVFFLQHGGSQARFLGVKNYQKISATSGGGGFIPAGGSFGIDIDGLGDLDGDGVEDLVVGTNTDGVWVLFMNADGTVASSQNIDQGMGGFGGTVNGTNFGTHVDVIGDLDDDGIVDLAISAYTDNDGGSSRGAVWIVFLDDDGTVQSEQKISDTAGGFTGTLVNNDFFGRSIAPLGDLDGDGIEDIAVGASGDDTGGDGTGAVWVLFLDDDGTVKSFQKLDSSTGGLSGPQAGSIFGISSDTIGDINNDGTNDLVVGAAFDDDGGANAGAVWVLLMDTDGTVIDDEKISAANGLDGLSGGELLGANASALNGNVFSRSGTEIIIGGPGANSAWIISVNPDGTLGDQAIISEGEFGFDGSVAGTSFGFGIGDVGDLNGDGEIDMVVGATGDSDGGASTGAIWVLFLDARFSQFQGTTPRKTHISTTDNSSCTPTREIELALSAEHAIEVLVSNDPLFQDAQWEPLSDTGTAVRNWLLPQEDGLHTIYVIYRSMSRNLSVVNSMSILLDQANQCR